MGNGFDALFLSRLLFPSSPSSPPSLLPSTLYCIDRQAGAIANTTQLLLTEFPADVVNKHVHFVHGSHAALPAALHADFQVMGIVYNLGYLPGSADKAVTTTAESTLSSLQESCAVLARGGLISVCAYRGHEGGEEEERQVREYFRRLDLRHWDVNQHVGMQIRGEETGPILYTARRRA